MANFPVKSFICAKAHPASSTFFLSLNFIFLIKKKRTSHKAAQIRLPSETCPPGIGHRPEPEHRSHQLGVTVSTPPHLPGLRSVLSDKGPGLHSPERPTVGTGCYEKSSPGAGGAQGSPTGTGCLGTQSTKNAPARCQQDGNGYTHLSRASLALRHARERGFPPPPQPREEAWPGKQPQQLGRPQQASPSSPWPGRLPSSCIPLRLKVGTWAPQARCLSFVESSLNKAFKTIILSHQRDICLLVSSL